MELVAITYSGAKPYTDKTPLRSTWQPGDTKRVPVRSAKLLLRFAEFSEAQRRDEDESREQDDDVSIAAVEAQRRDEDESREREGMLLMIESMDKDSLEAYARKYEVELDKRRSLATLRSDVTLLIEQFGVR